MVRKNNGIDHFNPRSPHGERHPPDECRTRNRPISIHAPRTGSDEQPVAGNRKEFSFQSTLPARGATCSINIWVRNFRFQSTLPARGATYSSSAARGSSEISIHAPRTGSDTQGEQVVRYRFVISIHAPRTGSDCFSCVNNSSVFEFQSTLPARGATFLLRICVICKLFQSTLPARGAT